MNEESFEKKIQLILNENLSNPLTNRDFVDLVVVAAAAN